MKGKDFYEDPGHETMVYTTRRRYTFKENFAQAGTSAQTPTGEHSVSLPLATNPLTAFRYPS
ncbi:Hypothetical predicted protein [Pelobates cultripes]|uniref:Uncharacterized protein n=1 Tax=Pelobates cultripes TaxID=61616 RepID=A0AAD1WDX5_PELCU|nr:Hypothetical predicted protein [Pelobates cultripes]